MEVKIAKLAKDIEDLKAKPNWDCKLPVSGDSTINVSGDLAKASQIAGCLKDDHKDELSLVSSYSPVPPDILIVVKAVMIVMGESTDEEDIKKQFADATAYVMLSKISCFGVNDVVKIPEARLEQLKTLLKVQNFDEVKVFSKQKAFTILCNWIFAVANYLEAWLKNQKDEKTQQEQLADLNTQLHALQRDHETQYYDVLGGLV